MSDPDPFAPPSVTPARATPPARPVEPTYGAHAPVSPSGGRTSGPSDPWGQPAPTRVAPTGLATWSVALASAWGLVQALMFASSSGAAQEFSRAVDAGASPGDVWTTYDSFATLLLPVQLAAFVVTCLWLHRSRQIAVAARPQERHVRGVVWIWLGWLVPVVSLWFPYQVVRDVRQGTTGLRRMPGLGLWWVSWLVMLWASNRAAFITSGFSRSDPGLLPVLDGVATAAVAVALVLWIRVVREVTAAQRSLPAG